MKRTNIFSRWMCLAMLLGCVGVSWGQTLNSAGETITANRTVTLNSSMALTGSITVNPGVTLTINGNNNVITTFTAEDETTSGKYSFIVNGTLIMNNVILDGGNTGNVGNSVNGGGEGAINAGATFKKSGTAIIAYNAATVKLTNVTARNLYANPKSSASFIYASYEKTGTTDVVISGRASIEMNQVTVENCLNNNDAGIIYTSSEYMRSTFTLEKCSIRNCMVKANKTGTGYGGVIKCAGKTDCNFTMKNSLMENCWGSGWGGAVLWAANGNNCKAVFEGCTFMNNYARYLGGAISSEAIVELIGCKILKNTAGFGGGGIAAFPFTLADSEGANTTQAIGLILTGNTISGNKTLYKTNINGLNVNSSARAKESDSSEQKLEKEIETGFNPRYTLLNATDVYYPSGGGGIWVLMNKDQWNCELNIEAGNDIKNNVSAYNGGGVFLYKQRPYDRDDNTDGNESVTFKNDYSVVGGEQSGATSMKLAATISQNKAAFSGGGAAVGADNTLSVFPDVTVTGGEITQNQASNGNGGGVYMPGGIFTIEKGEITRNKALIADGTSGSSEVGNGGGIAITNGEFKVGENTFIISENEAERYGGGLYVYNATQKVVFDGGTFEKNKAKAGGGVSLEGVSSGQKVELTLNANVKNNQATNGGGIYLNNYAEMTYTGGLLRNNIAGDGTTSKLYERTAYQKSVSEVSGVGGGVFMDNNTILNFNVTNELGFYGNRATNAADDIFANGNGTSVTLPKVDDMTLAGFSVPANRLFWAEDFYSHYENNAYEADSQYQTLLSGRPSFTDPAHNLRYQFALQHLKKKHIIEVPDQKIESKYVCLALGYEIFYITIKKEGLKDGESAMFNISTTKAGVPNPYISMLLTGDGEKNVVEKRIALPQGIWTVSEKTDWGWSYTLNGEASIEKEVNDDLQVFEFVNEKEATETLHDEAIKVNKMSGTSTTAQ